MLQFFWLFKSAQFSNLMLNTFCNYPCRVNFRSCSQQALSMWILRSLWPYPIASTRLIPFVASLVTGNWEKLRPFWLNTLACYCCCCQTHKYKNTSVWDTIVCCINFISGWFTRRQLSLWQVEQPIRWEERQWRHLAARRRCKPWMSLSESETSSVRILIYFTSKRKLIFNHPGFKA